MAIIPCEDIPITITELSEAFTGCKNVKTSDIKKLLDLVTAINNCNNDGGINYDTLVSNFYEPVATQIVTLPINTFHNITIAVLDGSIIYNSATLPSGATINLDFTTLNQTPIIVTIAPGSKVLIEYIIPTP